MKNILIILSISISCNKSRILNIPETGPPPVYFGECSFYKNGVIENAYLPKVFRDGSGTTNKNYFLQFAYYDNRNFMRVEFGFSYLYFKPYSVTIKNSIPPDYANIGNKELSGLYTIQSGGDVLEEKYYVDSTKPCVLNITKVDSATKELWGSFYGTYQLQRNAYTPAGYLNTVEITNGTFHTKVFE